MGFPCRSSSLSWMSDICLSSCPFSSICVSYLVFHSFPGTQNRGKCHTTVTSEDRQTTDSTEESLRQQKLEPNLCRVTLTSCQRVKVTDIQHNYHYEKYSYRLTSPELTSPSPSTLCSLSWSSHMVLCRSHTDSSSISLEQIARLYY